MLAAQRLSRLGATPLLISATFLAAAAIEAAMSPLAYRLSDRHGAYLPVRISLACDVVVSVLAPILAPAAVLITLLIIGMPSFGVLFPPQPRCSAPARTGSSCRGVRSTTDTGE